MSREVEKEAGMNWLKALPQDELPEGGRRVLNIGGRAVLLLHHTGQIYAVDP